jgi:hypothetical protein
MTIIMVNYRSIAQILRYIVRLSGSLRKHYASLQETNKCILMHLLVFYEDIYQTARFSHQDYVSLSQNFYKATLVPYARECC